MEYETAFRKRGFQKIAGIDEAGRGPLAGPVVAAAVMLPEKFDHPVLNDSKKLTAKRREVIYGELTKDPAVSWASAVVSVREIEKINILKASWLAMVQAVEKLSPRPDIALVDGLEIKGFPLPQEPLVKGDGLSLSIAAASVIAKVERDRLMVEYGRQYPVYGFEKHKGYGTKQHLESLRNHGPCPIHRKTFQPVAQLILEGV